MSDPQMGMFVSELWRIRGELVARERGGDTALAECNTLYLTRETRRLPGIRQRNAAHRDQIPPNSRSMSANASRSRPTRASVSTITTAGSKANKPMPCRGSNPGSICRSPPARSPCIACVAICRSTGDWIVLAGRRRCGLRAGKRRRSCNRGQQSHSRGTSPSAAAARKRGRRLPIRA
jgi:hypothetical protein